MYVRKAYFILYLHNTRKRVRELKRHLGENANIIFDYKHFRYRVKVFVWVYTGVYFFI